MNEGMAIEPFGNRGLSTPSAMREARASPSALPLYILLTKCIRLEKKNFLFIVKGFLLSKSKGIQLLKR